MPTNHNLFFPESLGVRAGQLLLGAAFACTVALASAAAQVSNPTKDDQKSGAQTEATPPVTAPPQNGLVKPPNVDPKMAQPVPNVDPGMNKPPADSRRPPPEQEPKTPPDVQPR